MTRMRHIKIGAFVAAGVVFLVTALLVFAEIRFWRTYDNYWTRFPYSVSGLSVGAPVELWGVRVGRIESIAFEGEGVRVQYEMEEDVKIPRGAEANVRMEGLTGVKYIDLQGGNLAGPGLAPGSEVKASASNLDLALQSALSTIERVDGMTQQLESILAKSDSVLGNIDALTGAVNREQIASALASASEATALARDAASAWATLSEATNRRVPELLDTLGRAASNTQKLSEEGVSIASELGISAAHTRRAALAVTTLVETISGELPDALAQIRAAALRAQTALRSLEDNPARLLRSKPRKEIPLP